MQLRGIGSLDRSQAVRRPVFLRFPPDFVAEVGSPRSASESGVLLVAGADAYDRHVEIRDLHDWPSTEAEAVAIQERLRPQVRVEDAPADLRTAAGLDVAYLEEPDRLVAAVTVLDLASLSTVDSVVVRGVADFPYVPGLFAFREAPPLLSALSQLSVEPDVLVCDGQGLAHPRRFGLACHLGVLTDLPSIGVGKNAMGRYEPPGEERGEWSPLLLDEEVVGRALRTQRSVKPVFVSVGHRFTLDAACDLVLRLAPKYRLPETTRTADRLGRTATR